MQSVHRQIGRMKKRTADDSQISELFHDFNEADQLLAHIIEAISSWRDAWSAILATQAKVAAEYEGLYAPIVGDAETPSSETAVITPEATMVRTQRLWQEYEELRSDMAQDLTAVDDRMIRPALQARDCLRSLRKTIKRREDRKLDYERHQNKFDSCNRKTKGTEKETIALAKAESDLAVATEEYQAADDHLRERLPPLINAALAMIPSLLRVQIDLQNHLLANYYTVARNYCEQNRFPFPSPPMEQVIEDWEQEHMPARQDMERLYCLANGKAVRTFHLPDDPPAGGGGIRDRLTNGFSSVKQRASGQSANEPAQPPPPLSRPASRPVSPGGPPPAKPPRPTSPGRTFSAPVKPPRPVSPGRPPVPVASKPAPVLDTKPRWNDTPSTSSLAVPQNNYHSNASNTHLSPHSLASSPTESYISASDHGGRPASAGVASVASSVAARADYFNSRRGSSQTPISPATSTTTPSIASPNLSAIAASKKKPPPPPKPRHMNAPSPVTVTAMYDFPGQSAGDLAFREGDVIRVLKKTDSTDDWWEGELNGVKGSFPANYVQ